MTRRWLSAPLATLCLLGCGEDSEVPPRVEPPSLATAASEAPSQAEPPPTTPAPDPAPDAATEAEPAPPEPVDPAVAARLRAEAAAAAFEARYPLHGLTYHFLARVRARPHREAPVVGYMRRGARFRASERVPGVGCARGWFEVPGEGYVCRGEGYLIGAEPPNFEPTPVPPALEDALPYVYAYTTRRDVPQYWRVPTPEEEASVTEVLETLAAREAAEATAAAETAPPDGADDRADDAADQPARDDDAAPAASAASPEASADAPGAAAEPAGTNDDAESDAAEEAEAPSPPGADPRDAAGAEETVDPSLLMAAQGSVEIPDFVRLRMGRGFFVSLDGEVEDGGRRFLRTVRGAYVRAEHLRTNEPPTHRGVVLGGRWQLPVAFVFRSGTHKLRRIPATGRFEDQGIVAQHTPFPVADRLTRGNRAYIVAREGFVVRRSALRVAERVSRPDDVPEGGRWLHVRLSEQTLVAYEGDRPVFATTVSTGRAGFETPTGLFRIQSKHVSTTMDDLNAGDESYLIEDVPWTMYFEGNYALHAAFWHEGFGRVRSHGCVNLAPADARWVFQWSSPTLPAAWHGVFADDEARAGTWVLITE